jgi:hypothetical protein
MMMKVVTINNTRFYDDGGPWLRCQLLVPPHDGRQPFFNRHAVVFMVQESDNRAIHNVLTAHQKTNEVWPAKVAPRFSPYQIAKPYSLCLYSDPKSAEKAKRYIIKSCKKSGDFGQSPLFVNTEQDQPEAQEDPYKSWNDIIERYRKYMCLEATPSTQ